MTKYVPRWLNDKALQELDGEFEDVIQSVLEQPIRNPFTAQRQFEPVIVFDSGWRLIPNIGMRKALIAAFGPETDKWRGRRIRVYRHRVERVNRATGESREHWQKSVLIEDAHARAPEYVGKVPV